MLRLTDGDHEVDRRNDNAVDPNTEHIGDDPLLAGPICSPAYDSTMCDYTQWKSETGQDDYSSRKE